MPALQTTAKFAASALRNLSLTPFESNLGPSDPKGKPYQGSSRVQVPERTTASFLGLPGSWLQACEHLARTWVAVGGVTRLVASSRLLVCARVLDLPNHARQCPSLIPTDATSP